MKRVLLIESGQFLGGVIRSLFTENHDFNIIEAAPPNGRELMRVVQKHQPQIVVIDDTLKTDYLERLLAYMRASEDMRVVVLNTSRNQVDVYRKQQVDVTGTADFLAVF